jgi:nicotinamidase-related amidase
MLESNSSCLVVIDVQGKLAELMHESSQMIKNICTMIKACNVLDVETIWCQQDPAAIGVTVPSISNLLARIKPHNKRTFSCMGHQTFAEEVQTHNKSDYILCGIEAHVCVYQTALDLLAKGKAVHILADAVSSRTQSNRQVAIDRLRAEGAKITSVEMALFEIMRSANHPCFKQVARLIK